MPITLGYLAIILIRKWCYKIGLLKTHILPVPVIVIGNITLGGTGKTPLVIFVANSLKKRGLKVGIISRGYGRSSSATMVVEKDGDYLTFGDEPLLVKTHTDCPVVVGKNRVRAAKKLLELSPCDVIISDDGLQHYALERDIEIAVIDGVRQFGNGFLFPSGPLREPRSRLQRCNFVVINGSPKQTATPSSSYQYYMGLQSKGFYPVNAQMNQEISQDSFRGKKVHAFAGIGNPQRFFSQLKELGLDISPHAFKDHHHFVPTDFAFLKADDIVVMTEKDAVKCGSFAKNNWYFLKVEAQITENFAQNFYAFILKKNLAQNSK